MNLISVIICTYNRVDMLSVTLQSWLSVDDAGYKAEMIIVDNNSTDSTSQLVASFRAECPGQLRYVRETKTGLSHARNRGIQEASGDIIAFVDDDIFFDKSWLKEICRAFLENPEVACVGGKSIPKFETTAPEWITEKIYRFYGSTCSGEQDRLMVFPEHPFGLNMAFRKSIFSQVGEFNPNLGRLKGNLLSNDETDLFHRIHKSQLKVYFASKAILFHRIPAERTEKHWVLKRNYWQGVSDVVYQQINKPGKKIFLAFKTLRISKNIIFFFGRKYLNKIIPEIKPCSFNEEMAIYYMLGMARQNIFEMLFLRKD